jgi:hypothetical protein
MERDEAVNIPASVLSELKKQLNKYMFTNDEPDGFNEAIRYVALEKATKTQLAKLASFSKNRTSDASDKTKYEILHKMIIFAENWIIQDKLKKSYSNKVRIETGHPTGASSKNQTGREVNRNEPSLDSLKPSDINENLRLQECTRILDLINKIV